MQRNIKKLIKMIQALGRRMVAKIPENFWNPRNLWKNHTIYGIAGIRKIQNTVLSVEME